MMAITTADILSFSSHQIGVLIFLGFLWLVSLSNLRGLRKLHRYPPTPDTPPVSILVPARNEESNIGPCVLSLLAQDYPNYEVLVLDDASTDHTGEILADLARSHPKLRLLQGRPLPEGWLGKLWACDQLAQAAQGELLLFTDADTRHHPLAVRDAASALIAEEADLVTALPQEEVRTWGERLTVPLIPWSLFTFLPVGLAHRLHWPPLSAAIGQFLLFRRDAYHQVGGHASVRHNSADDLALARRIIRHGYRWRLMDGSSRVQCSMYTGFRSAFQGLSKSLFAAFDYRLWLYVPIWLWLAVVFITPPVTLALFLAGVTIPGFSPPLAAASTLLAAGQWALFTWRLRYPPILIALYPLVLLVAVLIVFHSIWQRLTGRAAWKGRTMPAPKSSRP